MWRDIKPDEKSELMLGTKQYYSYLGVWAVGTITIYFLKISSGGIVFTVTFVLSSSFL